MVATLLRVNSRQTVGVGVAGMVLDWGMADLKLNWYGYLDYRE